MRAYSLTSARPSSPDLPRGRGVVVETAKVALAYYPEAGLLILQARRPRTGGVVLDLDDLGDEALALLREFAGGPRTPTA